MTPSLSICRTCPRDDPASGNFGHALYARLETRLKARGIGLLLVNCLGSCKRPGAIALDSPDKARVRFSGLAIEDADPIVSAIDAYVICSKVVPAIQAASPSLVSRISAISPKISLMADQMI
jgi:predicted metal-binding protein